MEITKDHFLTSVLKNEVYNVKETKGKSFKKIHNSKKKTLYCANIETTNNKLLHNLINKKFKLISTNIILEVNYEKFNIKNNKMFFRMAVKEDEKQVLNLSKLFKDIDSAFNTRSAGPAQTISKLLPSWFCLPPH